MSHVLTRIFLLKQSFPQRIYVYEGVFCSASPALSLSIALRLSLFRLAYHVYTFGAVMSLPTNAIRKKKKGRQWREAVQRISKEKKEKKKNGPKSSAQKKTRDFFLLLRLRFFLSMKLCLLFSLVFFLLFLLSIKCMRVQVRSFVRQSFFSFSILYVKKKKESRVLLHKIYYIFFTVRYHQRTSCCALSLSFSSLEQQPTQLLISYRFFLCLSEGRERKGKIWYLCPKTYGNQRKRGVCGWVWERQKNEWTNKREEKENVKDLDWCLYCFNQLNAHNVEPPRDLFVIKRIEACLYDTNQTFDRLSKTNQA